ncbi:MAG: DUF2993 domain-containing protein [Cyanobacteriota bacterium]
MSPSPSSTSDSSGPLLQLLASGLQLWVRQQCEAIESLEIRLEGSAMALLRGRLEGVQVMARRVTYQGLQIELVELHSEAIQVQMGQALRGRGLQLGHPFQIRGQVSFTADGLTRSLARPEWRSLGDAIGEDLLGITPLTELRVQANRLVLATQGVAERGLIELDAEVRAVDGTLEIRGMDAAPEAAAMHRLPMDPNITIEQAGIEGGMLRLQGEARVSP